MWGIGLVAILALAAGLRFYGLDFQSLWLNELDSWWISQHDHLGIVLGRGVMEDLHPPGYQVLLYFVIHTFGDSESILRFPSAVAGVLSVFVLALLGKRLYDPLTGLLAGAFLSILWVPVYYSQEARSYSLLMLASISSTYFLVRVCQETEQSRAATWNSRFAYILTAAFTCYLHYFGLLVVACHVAIVLVRLGMNRQTFALFAGVGILYAPWLPSMWQDLQVTEHWIRRPGLRSWINLYLFAFNKSAIVAFAIAMPLHLWACSKAFFNLLAAKISTQSWRRDPTVLLVLWILIPTALAYLKSHISTPVWSDRNLIICFAPMYILAARGIALLPTTKYLRGMVACLVLVVMLAHLVFAMHYYSASTKENYREAVEYVINHSGDTTPKVVGSKGSYYYDYYFDHFGSDTRVALVAWRQSDIDRLDAFVRRMPQDMFWLVQGAFYPPEPELQAHLESTYEVVDQAQLYGSRATLLRAKVAND